MKNHLETEDFFEIGWCPERGTVTIEYPCCEHTDPGIEGIHFTPEKAVFLARMILEKVSDIYWSKREGKL